MSDVPTTPSGRRFEPVSRFSSQLKPQRVLQIKKDYEILAAAYNAKPIGQQTNANKGSA